jgi:hypothetical protein
MRIASAEKLSTVLLYLYDLQLHFLFPAWVLLQ